ncbi:sensor histidine kinase [Candidatus Halocynthiibacter alkanivorans]|uniref:sensor histidine kinase n=1 Tax=Candidatus Halocynthiibacter alkanivorans TaxID=2267619 RepID=UPI000DF3180C|nr:ATP-binding protein [Candidatus Halocynthiibacter alkanivorans]
MNAANSTLNLFWRYLLTWGIVLVLTLSALALVERQKLVRELTVKSATLHRLASQRADQHDAHLTSLSAIFVAGGKERQDLFLDVAATIMRFYPRIISVNVIPFEPSEMGIQTLPGLTDDDMELVRETAHRSTGALQIRRMSATPHRYLLVKRSPNTDAARHGIALVIDAEALIASDDPFWERPSVSLRLLTPERGELTGTIAPEGAEFSKPLGSASQPLILETSLAISLVDLLPLGKTISAATLVSVLLLLTILGFRQRAHIREAESRAKLSAQETRLAHASRVNSMGEMASGMAHELAQPLTAILSQAQAGRHLARRGDIDRLSTVLGDTVAQAQRASDILDRLRRWSRPNRVPSKACSLNDAVRSVDRLLALEVKSAGAAVTLTLADDPILIDADPVELEQVVFNLVRNALDASKGARVSIRTEVSDGAAVLEVADDGPGVPMDLRSRIFEPFVTGKPDGTGLGLALCQRLIEEMDGDIALLPDTTETTFRLSLPVFKTQGVT